MRHRYVVTIEYVDGGCTTHTINSTASEWFIIQSLKQHDRRLQHGSKKKIKEEVAALDLTRI